MRSLIQLIVIAAAAYLGYMYYTTGSLGLKIGGATPSTSVETSEPAETPSAPAPPVFKSKIPVSEANPDGKHLAKPGVYYVLERASVEHDTGIAAVVPGDEVKLMMRKDNGSVKVTNGKFEFEMKESQITNDLDVAREFERKYALTHPPARR